MVAGLVIEGIPSETILDREPELLKRACEELPMLPVEDLDLDGGRLAPFPARDK